MVTFARLLLITAIFVAWALAATAAPKDKDKAPCLINPAYPWAFTECWRLKAGTDINKLPTRPNKQYKPASSHNLNTNDPNLQ